MNIKSNFVLICAFVLGIVASVIHRYPNFTSDDQSFYLAWVLLLAGGLALLNQLYGWSKDNRLHQYYVKKWGENGLKYSTYFVSSMCFLAAAGLFLGII